jgi:hypothetical protein
MDLSGAGNAGIIPVEESEETSSARKAVWLTETQLREVEYAAAKWLIQDELPVGYTIMMGAPKTGKTALTLPMAQRLADAGYEVAYLALDDSPRRMQERSIMADPDKSRDNLSFCFWAPKDTADAFEALKWWLTQRKLLGHNPFDIIFIDTYGVFVGAGNRSAKASVFSGDYQIGQAFKQVCETFDCSLFVNHHTRKGRGDDADGDWLDMMSGSQGVAGSADAIWYIKRTRGSRDGVLHMTSNDGGDVTRPIVLAANMVWEPSTTATVAEAERTGVARDILEHLRQLGRGAALADIVGDLDESKAAVKKALQRLSGEGLVLLQGTEWRLDRGNAKNWPATPGVVVPRGEREAAPEPSPAEGPVQLGPCVGCGLEAAYQYDGETWHVECKQRADDARVIAEGVREMVVAQQAELSDEPEEPETPEERNGFLMLKDSIEAKGGTQHPMMRVPKAERDAEPWSLITERMSGEHRWGRKVSPDTLVRVLDRNGSYPSAMGSVPLVPNKLHHTGPMDTLPAQVGGIFLIDQVDWTEETIGHPLGRLGDQEGPIWISTPHLKLLLKLAAADRIAPVEILDSWTGKSSTNLFTAFSKEVAARRKAAEGFESVTGELKRTTSAAIRCLWPKAARSPFWRPDWSVSVRAEASVRHWAVADKAVAGGAQLVKLGTVDEAAFVVPETVAVSTWAPAPYRVGKDFGMVKLKDLLTGDEWNGSVRGVR